MTDPALHCPRCNAVVQPAQEYCLECGGRLGHARPGAVERASAGMAERHSVGRRLDPAGAARARHRSPRDRRRDRDLRQRRGTERCLDRNRGQPHRHRHRLDADRSGADDHSGDDNRSADHDDRPSTAAEPRRRHVATGRARLDDRPALAPPANGRSAAAAKATEARSGGLRRVGVLDSSHYASLHPGYYVVFTGIFDTEAEAASALQRAKAVFPTAYQREIVP